MHERVGDLTVKIRSPNDMTKQVYSSPGNLSSNLFLDVDLIEEGFSSSEFESTGTWELIVEDSTGLNTGRIEYFRVMTEHGLDPLNDDCDDDGILDGEEAELGEDGYRTNPLSDDTDDDGMDDAMEILGMGISGKRTDPTSNDIDGDTFKDDQDHNPLGDAVLEIWIRSFEYHSGCMYPSDGDVFFTIEADGYSYSTARYHAQDLEWNFVDMVYYIDVWDTNDSVSIDLNAYHDCGIGDDHLDIFSGDGYELPIQYALKNSFWEDEWGTVEFHGDGNGSQMWGNLTLQIRTIVREKSNTVVVNSTDYGLYEVPSQEDEYRYTGDDQVYMFYLNCSSSSDHFVEGINTVVLPRSMALQSCINDTLSDLGNISGNSPLHGAAFSTTDPSMASSSHIIAIISQNMTGQEAESLLVMMTRNSTDAVIGNFVVMGDTESIYLSHMPRDVISHIPLLDLESSPLGSVPEGSGLVNFIVTAFNLVYEGFVWMYDLMADIASAVVEVGLQVLGALTAAVSDIVDAIANAVDAIVDAFLEFVEWAIEFIQAIVDTVFGPIVDAISDLVDSYCSGVQAALDMAEMDVRNTGNVSSSSLSMLSDALHGDLYWVLLSISAIVTAVLLLIKPITITFGFLLSLAITFIVAVVVEQALNGWLNGEDDSNPPYPIGLDAYSIDSWMLSVGGDNGINNVFTEIGFMDRPECRLQMLYGMIRCPGCGAGFKSRL